MPVSYASDGKSNAIGGILVRLVSKLEPSAYSVLLHPRAAELADHQKQCSLRG